MAISAETSRAAVFYDIDNTLVDSRVIYAYLYFALRMPRISERVARLTRTALLSPVYAAAGALNRALFYRLFYASYKGMPLERLRLMGSDAVQKAILPHIYEEARRRIAKAQSMGLVQVLVSASPDFIVQPLAESLGIEHSICNELEYANGFATGKIVPPLLLGEDKARAVARFAREQRIDLLSSYAFADSLQDRQMLETVGFPSAVNAQPGLAEAARERGWPLLQFI